MQLIEVLHEGKIILAAILTPLLHVKHPLTQVAPAPERDPRRRVQNVVLDPPPPESGAGRDKVFQQVEKQYVSANSSGQFHCLFAVWRK